VAERARGCSLGRLVADRFDRRRLQYRACERRQHKRVDFSQRSTRSGGRARDRPIHHHTLRGYPSVLASRLEKLVARHLFRPSGGRAWWAHSQSTSINIELTIFRNEIEDWCDARDIAKRHGIRSRVMLKLRSAARNHDGPAATCWPSSMPTSLDRRAGLRQR
jgi:hypothetical protein